MKYLIKGFMLAAIVVIGTATVSSVEAISSDEAVQSALARVPGATVANVTEFNRDYENGRLEYEGEIHITVMNMILKLMQILGSLLNGK